DAFEYDVEVAYQLGENYAGGRTPGDISALIAGLYAGALLDKESQFRVGAGLEYYTGDNRSTANVNEAAELLFITLHKFYGAMDFFPTTITPTTGQRRSPAVTNLGLINPYLRVEASLLKDWKFSLFAHYFMAQQPFENASVSTRDIGTEIDLDAIYTVSRNVSLRSGISAFLPGEALKQSNGAVGLGTDPAYWAYTMLMLNF
ncbi:MAG TPA: alginate export family protein, partial [Patescibacteria group bacterium]|nr:alginate export family protein [Patescibacteria group bacterium]